MGSQRDDPYPHPPDPASAPHLHYSLDVAVPLGEVHGAQTRGALAVFHVRAEHGPGALPLSTDHAAHGGRLGKAHGQHPGGPSTRATLLQGPASPGFSLPSLAPSALPSPAVRPSVLSGVRLGPRRAPERRMAADGGGWKEGLHNPKDCLPAAEGGRKRSRGARELPYLPGPGHKSLDLPGRRRGREHSACREL